MNDQAQQQAQAAGVALDLALDGGDDFSRTDFGDDRRRSAQAASNTVGPKFSINTGSGTLSASASSGAENSGCAICDTIKSSLPLLVGGAVVLLILIKGGKRAK